MRWSLIERWRRRWSDLRTELAAIALACRHAGTPWYAKVLALCVVAYALSPIDLIPDPIPVLGHLDDVVLIPLGILLVQRLIPQWVLAECRKRVNTAPAGSRGRWVAAGLVVACWVLVVWVCVRFAAALFAKE